ncbi:hypothetical protein LINPERPRIM_LOCUS15090 [Linum perenne]
MRVFLSMAQRLWGYEGRVCISKLTDNFFLLEFHSVQLCTWVLECSWNVHNSGLILWKWERGINPIDFSPKATPEWIEFQGVPPKLIYVEGVSWLSSKIGKPLNPFVREGTSIRVCVLRDKAIPCPSELKVVFTESERYTIVVL